MTPDSDLQERWQQLVKAVLDEGSAHGQLLDPGTGGNMKLSDAELKISLPIGGRSYYSRTFTREEVLRGDIAKLARDFYRDYRDVDK